MKGPAERALPPSLCDSCRAIFTPSRSDQVYCSRACRQAAYRDRTAMRNATVTGVTDRYGSSLVTSTTSSDGNRSKDKAKAIPLRTKGYRKAVAHMLDGFDQVIDSCESVAEVKLYAKEYYRYLLGVGNG
jgi:hypothetical protein